MQGGKWIEILWKRVDLGLLALGIGGVKDG